MSLFYTKGQINRGLTKFKGISYWVEKGWGAGWALEQKPRLVGYDKWAKMKESCWG